MNKFAFINDNKVVEVREAEEGFLFEDAHRFQQVIDVTVIAPLAAVDWVFENGALFRKIDDVTPRQIRQALILSGVDMAMIEAALNSLPEPTKSLAKTEWEYSIAFKRNRPLVKQVGLMLGWTPQQLDDLWLFAAKL